MCGRYAQSRTSKKLERDLAIDRLLVEPQPSWNVAPTHTVPVVVERLHDDELVRELRGLRWGLVPSWAKDPGIGSRMINARVETILEKPSFRKAARARRCVVPMDGYYEWKPPPAGTKGRKTPFYLHGDGPLAAAGLYELWRDPERADDDPDRWLWTVTVITTEATDTLGHIHDRSPLLLPESMWADWLNPGIDGGDDVRELLAGVPEPRLTPREVGVAVGNVRNDGPELVEAVT